MRTRSIGGQRFPDGDRILRCTAIPSRILDHQNIAISKWTVWDAFSHCRTAAVMRIKAAYAIQFTGVSLIDFWYLLHALASFPFSISIYAMVAHLCGYCIHIHYTASALKSTNSLPHVAGERCAIFCPPGVELWNYWKRKMRLSRIGYLWQSISVETTTKAIWQNAVFVCGEKLNHGWKMLFASMTHSVRTEECHST